MDRRGVKDHAVVIDDRQSVGVDIESIIASERRFNGGHGMASAQKFLQDLPPLFLFIRRGFVVLPAELFGVALFIHWDVLKAARVCGGAFHNLKYIHIWLLILQSSHQKCLQSGSFAGLSAGERR